MRRLILLSFASVFLAAGVATAQPGPLPVTALSDMRVLGKLTAADMNVTTDQPIPLALGGATKWLVGGTATAASSIAFIITGCNGVATTANGTVYLAAGKAGGAIATAGTFANLTGAATQAQRVALNAGTDVKTATTVYFSLTTPQGSAVTCDVYVIGVPLQ